ncbi:hypothetical protein BGZ58_004305, partial [Dissophora ornata]
PSTQLLEATPLNAITNLPRVHNRTHPLPGTAKGKHTQGKTSLSKSQTTATFQTRLDFQKKSKHQQESPERENATTEQDQMTVRALENSLEDLKQSVEQLQRQCEQEEATLSSMRGIFKKEDSVLTEQNRDAEMERKELEATVADQESEIQKYEEQVLDLKFQIENKLLEIHDRERELEQFEEATLKELGLSDLQEKNEELIELKGIISKETDTLLSELSEVVDYAEDDDGRAVIVNLKNELQEHDVYIECLENDLSLKNDDMDAELTSFLLGHSIEGEFMAHRARYDLTKGSDLDKEVTKYQKQLVIKHERQISSLTQQHTVQMEQITMKTQSHERRLAKLQKNIEDAVKTIDRSEQDFEDAEIERVQMQEQTDALKREIMNIRQQLALL